MPRNYTELLISFLAFRRLLANRVERNRSSLWPPQLVLDPPNQEIGAEPVTAGPNTNASEAKLVDRTVSPKPRSQLKVARSVKRNENNRFDAKVDNLEGVVAEKWAGEFLPQRADEILSADRAWHEVMYRGDFWFTRKT